MFRTSREKKVSFLLKDFNLYEDSITIEGENFNLLELQSVKGTKSISTGEELEFSYVFLIGNVDLIKEFHQELKGGNGIESLGKRISIELEENIQLEEKLVNYRSLENEVSRSEAFENSLDREKVKVKEELSARYEKNSLFLNYIKEVKRANFFSAEGEEEINWWSTKKVLIGKLEAELSEENKEEDIEERTRAVKEIRGSTDETGAWVNQIFFSNSPKFRVRSKTPQMILDDWKSELVKISIERTTHPSLSPTFLREDSTLEETTWPTEKTEERGAISESKDEVEEVFHSIDVDEESEEEPETTEGSTYNVPHSPEHEVDPTISIEEDGSEEETASTTDEEHENKPEVSWWEKIGKKNLIIGTIVIVIALILVLVILVTRKKKVNKTSPNKLQPKQPTDKKDIVYDPFVY
jgi:hypothetical protein